MFVDRKHSLTAAIDSQVLQSEFVSKVVNESTNQTTKPNYIHKIYNRVVSGVEYVPFLRDLISSVNPFCQFSVLKTKCVVKNKREEDKRIRTFNVRLGCESPGCPALVIVNVFNPSGDVTLSFLRGNIVKKPFWWRVEANDEEGRFVIYDSGGWLFRWPLSVRGGSGLMG